MSNELDMGNEFNEWVDFFQEGYDIYSINNEIESKNSNNNENYFSFKDDKPTKETNFVIENINNFNINNIQMKKEDIEVLNTEEEDKNVIQHNTQSNETSDKIRLENEIKQLNEKLKMYKAKIPKPPIHPTKAKTRNKPKQLKGNNSYVNRVKNKKTNFINLDIVKENTYENMYKGKGKRLLSSTSSSSLLSNSKQMPVNITNTRITNYHIVNHINVNNKDDLCYIEKRLKEYKENSTNSNIEKGTNRLVPSGCESKSNRVSKEKEENLNEDVSSMIEKYNMAKRMKKKRNKVSIDDFIQEKKNRKEIEIKIENSNHQIEYKSMYQEELSPIHKINIDTPVIENKKEKNDNVKIEDKINNDINNNYQGELSTISEVKKENSYIEIKQSETKKKKNNIPKKKTNDDTIPFHLIDKEKIYHNLVKYMYGNVPHKKSKRNKSTQH